MLYILNQPYGGLPAGTLLEKTKKPCLWPDLGHYTNGKITVAMYNYRATLIGKI